MYKEAARKKLLFHTSKGLLNIYQIWDLKLPEIVKILKALKDRLEMFTSSKLDFLEESETVTEEQKELELAFTILKDVYLTKKEEQENHLNSLEIKKHNAKIDEYILKKREAKMEELSEEELLKLKK